MHKLIPFSLVFLFFFACDSSPTRLPILTDGGQPDSVPSNFIDGAVPIDAAGPTVDATQPQIDSQIQIDSGVPVTGFSYFSRQTVWYHDISQAAKDPQSDTVIAEWVSRGGWGTGKMAIDFSIEVLTATSSTQTYPFICTSDFWDGDCDYSPFPLPVGGALEEESDYACQKDGDCHLIVHVPDMKMLYEMWRANIVGGTVSGTFYGGCASVWDLSQDYGWTHQVGSATGDWGRTKSCTSADASGFPIAPLLFTADEVQAGEIDHAIRFILPNNRIANDTYVYPATHATSVASAPQSTGVPYGALLRLRADYPLQNLPNDGARVIARAMQKYGLFLSDGGNIALTAQSDRYTTAKWSQVLGSNAPHVLNALAASDFELIKEGQRQTQGDCKRPASGLCP
jgi:hypothetical protein